MVRLLDQFHAGRFLIVEADKLVKRGDVLTLGTELVQVLEVVFGDRGRLGLKVAPCGKSKTEEVLCHDTRNS